MSLFFSTLLLASAVMSAPLEKPDVSPIFSNATITAPLNSTIPSPLQPGIVANCDEFYLVKSGDFCFGIAASEGITLDQFLEWNPSAGAMCTNLLADHYACVSVEGHTPTPTQPPNGIETPMPIQEGMVNNCNKFHFVESGDTCPAIQEEYGVTLEDLAKWNPAIQDDCTLMWANTNLCVGIMA